ncbi:MAG: hypothetical protein P4L46_19970 [Fimbriimonas sp.]|nr:hypothetical protein [Fimbriimonas sp.]
MTYPVACLGAVTKAAAWFLIAVLAWAIVLVVDGPRALGGSDDTERSGLARWRIRYIWLGALDGNSINPHRFQDVQ